MKTFKVIPADLHLQCIQKSYLSHLLLSLFYWKNPLALPPELTTVVLYKSFRIYLKKLITKTVTAFEQQHCSFWNRLRGRPTQKQFKILLQSSSWGKCIKP